MSEWYRYEPSGRIVTVGGCADGEEPFYFYPGETLVAGPRVDPHRHWHDIETNEARDRETTDIQAIATTVTGIPVPCALRITGPVTLDAVLDESELSLSFDIPGTYTLVFDPEHPRWLPKTLSMEVLP